MRAVTRVLAIVNGHFGADGPNLLNFTLDPLGSDGKESIEALPCGTSLAHIHIDLPRLIQVGGDLLSCLVCVTRCNCSISE